MERITWFLINTVVFILTTTGFIYMSSSPAKVATLVSPIETPATSSVVNNDTSSIEIVTTYLESVREAESKFLLQFHGANIAAFNDTKTLNDLGYKGYYAWYNGTLATNAVLWKNNTVIVIKYIDIAVYTDRQDRLLFIESYILTYLKEKDTNGA